MRKAWIMQEPTGRTLQPFQFRLVSESTLFPGKAQPHVAAFVTSGSAARAAQVHGLKLTGDPLTLPLVTAEDRDRYRLEAQRRAELALNRERGLNAPVAASNVVYLDEQARRLHA